MEFYGKNEEKKLKKTEENNKSKNEEKEPSYNKDNPEEISSEEKTNKTEKENKNETPSKNINKTRQGKKKTLVISLITIITLCIVIFCCTIFALLNINNSRIIKGVYVNKIDIGNLTINEAKDKVKAEFDKNLEEEINVKYDNFEYSIKLSQIEVKYNIEEIIKKAQDIGRGKNIFVDNYEIIKAKIKKENLDLEYSYNEDLLDEIINDISVKIPDAVIEPSYYIENDKLYISKGTEGKTIKKDKLKEEILERVKGIENREIILEVYNIEPSNIDIDKIYKEVYKEPKDAYYTKEPFEIFPQIDGIDFDIEAAKELIKEAKEEYEIPLIITKPQITTSNIGAEAFPDLISSFTTKYDASNIPRTTNLKLAMQKLNEVVVNPGETFSYNKTLGKRTAEAGYKEAGGYAGGKVVQTIAGGICQISSTLYDAVLYANLDIVERHNHMFLAGYVGAGKDATVVYGVYDFKFKNTRKYPIMIKTSIGNGVAKISIFGIKEEVEYEVEISTKVLGYTPYKVIYENDSSLEEGKEKVSQSGMNGCKSITYKIVKLNGKQISSTVLSTDTYDPMNKIIKKGTKANQEAPVVNPITEPEPEPVPEVEPIEENSTGEITNELEDNI